MRPDTLAPDWARLSDVIAEAMGVHFPRERWPDLQRGLADAAGDLGFTDSATLIDSLLSAAPTQAQTQVLAQHLTIGETYFFRDKKLFEILANQILPALIAARRNGHRRLRFWSAACCTGEEAYSLAIMVHQLLPDLADWQVTILATDLNERFLQKATAGSYGEWSFRDAPAGLKERYFTQREDGRFVIAPEIRRMVTFASLNLVQADALRATIDTQAMDVIFCRNVLMYFSPDQAARVIKHLHQALNETGWLAVGPSEVSQRFFSGFVTQNFPGVILYQKNGTPLPYHSPIRVLPETETYHAFPAPTFVARLAAVAPPSRITSKSDAVNSPAASETLESREIHEHIRALANRGQLAEALAWCDRGIAANRADSVSHYLRAAVLVEQKNAKEARLALQRTVYLDPTFVLAHFALGNLARADGRADEAERHFANAQRLLVEKPADEPLLEADGLTAGRLAAMLATMTNAKATA